MILSNRVITLLAVLASVFIGAFLLVLSVPPFIYGASSPILNYISLRVVRVALLAASAVSLFGIGPSLIYSFRERSKLESATNHHIRNKMQELILMLDALEHNLIVAPNPGMTYQEKIEMFNKARAICADVSENTIRTILKEAPNFDVRTAHAATVA